MGDCVGLNRLTSMKFGITKGGSRRAKRWRARPAWSCETVLTAVEPEAFTEQPALARLAAVDADIGPVEGRDRHRTRLSKSAGERRGDVRERHRVVGVQNLKALPSRNARHQGRNSACSSLLHSTSRPTGRPPLTAGRRVCTNTPLSFSQSATGGLRAIT